MGTLRTTAAVASVSFLIQALVWVVLSFLGILAHTCHFSPPNDQIDVSFTAMAKVYFSDPSCWRGGTIIGKLGLMNGSQMITITSLQFVFNFLQAIVTVILLFVIPRSSSYTFLLWLYNLLFLSIAVAIMDIITATMLSADKDLLSSGSSSIPEAEGLKSMLLVTTFIAARGYLYWALNIILVLYLLTTATRRLFKACKSLDKMKDQNGNVNPAFESDENGYPNYCARSRWPRLGIPLWKRQMINQLYEHRDQSYQRERAGFGNREALEQRSKPKEQRYTRPVDSRNSPVTKRWQYERNGGPPPSRPQPQRSENPRPRDISYERQRMENTNVPRPNSLHEAILTLKPLKQVRPRLPEVQSRY